VRIQLCLWRTTLLSLRGDSVKKRPLLKNKKVRRNNKRNITLRVSSLWRVPVIAPDECHHEAIHEAWLSVAKWIWDALVACRSNRICSAQDYVSGGMQFYLGKRYVWKSRERLRKGKRSRWREASLVTFKSFLMKHKTARCESTGHALVSSECPERVFQERLMANNCPNPMGQALRVFFVCWPMQKQWGSCSLVAPLLL